MDKGLVGGMMSIDFLGAADHSSFSQAKRKRERIDSPAIHEMDFFSIRPGRPAFPGAVKKEELADDGGGGAAAKLVKSSDVNTGLKLNLLIANTGSEQSTVDDGSSDDKESKTHELAVLQLELNRMNEENRRLKEMLTQVSSNYNALQMQLFNFMQQQHRSKSSEVLDIKSQPTPIPDQRLDQDKVVPRQFMDPGRAMDMEQENSESSSEGRTESASPRKYGFRQQGNVNATASNEILSNDNTVADGVDGRRSSAKEDSSDQGSHGWAPNKAVPAKNDDQSNEATLRKARVSVRARSEASMISDGCQWRKYGQKMAKGNPCPRAYYRCTMAPGCPVRKQVQRCAEDRSILITTYEGSHNHPLPPAAMAMASTTSAAASMLLFGSMSSADGGLMNNFLARTVLPCSSNMATISASAPFPTVTLDLTNTPSPLQFQRPPSQFPVPFAGVPQGFSAPATATMPQIFGQSLYNQSKFSGLHVSPNVDAVVPNQFAVPHLPPTQGPPPSLADTVSAATAAITADPNFTAALAAAITSIIGGGGAPVQSAILNDKKQ